MENLGEDFLSKGEALVCVVDNVRQLGDGVCIICLAKESPFFPRWKCVIVRG